MYNLGSSRHKYPFHVNVDASANGVDSILIHEFPTRKRIVSFNSRVYTKDEQKMSTTARELCGVISALQTCDHYIIGSTHAVYLYIDHKPLLYLWGRRGKLSHRFFPLSACHFTISKLEINLDRRQKSSFPRHFK